MRELDRLKVIQAVVDRMLKPGLAAERLHLTVRQVERLVLRHKQAGSRGWFSCASAPAITNPIIWFGEPTEMDRRLLARLERSWHRACSTNRSKIFAQYFSDTDPVRKIVIPLSVRDEGMRSLYRMNITNAPFPDLEELARSIALELEVVWPKM